MAIAAVARLALWLLAAQSLRAAGGDEDAHAAFEAAGRLRTSDPEASIAALRRAAEGGIAEAQVALGVAHVYGQGGLARDGELGKRWLRAAAAQGHSDAAYNLVALCEGRPLCVRGGEAATEAQALTWLLAAAEQGLAAAGYEAAHLLMRAGDAPAALAAFVAAAQSGHAPSMYNTGHLCASGAAGVPLDLGAAVLWFGAAARQAADPKVAADAAVAAPAVRRLWVQNAEAAPDMAAASSFFEAARPLRRGAAGGDAALRGWRRGAAHWVQWERSFAEHPSYDNRAALRHLRAAMEEFEATLPLAYAEGSSGGSGGGGSGDGGSGGSGEGGESGEGNGEGYGGGAGELRQFLLLAKLAEGAKALARDPTELRGAVRWLEALATTALCGELYATVETQPSCFNDQLAAAITMYRRLGDAQGAARLVAAGNAHPHAATRWGSAEQTPRVLAPDLEARGWWDGSRFGVAAALEEAWASGAISQDLARIGISGGGRGGFERIVSSASPISAASGADGDGAGVWSEFMLFDGTTWIEERCARAAALCALLRAAPEVAGEVHHADGSVTAPQGQVTIFRLAPGAHVLPHVGVTNRRLVLQLPLQGWQGVRFRVGDEWRAYAEGRAMVFDDSFEHEVVHSGEQPRFVLYAVLHHPDLGTPTLVAAPETEACEVDAERGESECTHI
jgi:TPR repeat protein